MNQISASTHTVLENRGRMRGNSSRFFDMKEQSWQAARDLSWTSMDALARPAFPFSDMHGLRRHCDQMPHRRTWQKDRRKRSVTPIEAAATHAISPSTRKRECNQVRISHFHVCGTTPGGLRVRRACASAFGLIWAFCSKHVTTSTSVRCSSMHAQRRRHWTTSIHRSRCQTTSTCTSIWPAAHRHRPCRAFLGLDSRWRRADVEWRNLDSPATRAHHETSRCTTISVASSFTISVLKSRSRGSATTCVVQQPWNRNVVRPSTCPHYTAILSVRPSAQGPESCTTSTDTEQQSSDKTQQSFHHYAPTCLARPTSKLLALTIRSPHRSREKDGGRSSSRQQQ